MALSYYKSKDYTSALHIFEGIENPDDPELLYYYGGACEALNLFGRALELYAKIDKGNYESLAREQILGINLKRPFSLDDLEDEEVKALAKDAPTQKDYPNAGAIILLDDDRFEIKR